MNKNKLVNIGIDLLIFLGLVSGYWLINYPADNHILDNILGLCGAGLLMFFGYILGSAISNKEDNSGSDKDE